MIYHCYNSCHKIPPLLLTDFMIMNILRTVGLTNIFDHDVTVAVIKLLYYHSFYDHISLTRSNQISDFAKCRSLSAFITWRNEFRQVCYLSRLYVCLCVCLLTSYRPQFSSNHFEIFFAGRYFG